MFSCSLWSEVLQTRAGSRRLNELCGLGEEGRLRSAWHAGGRRVDVMIFGILADEWRAHRNALRRTLSSSTILTLGGDTSAFSSWPALGPLD